MSQTAVAGKTFLQRLLDGIEVVGNKVPHPAVIFLLMSAIVIVLSQIFHMLGTSVGYQVIAGTSGCHCCCCSSRSRSSLCRCCGASDAQVGGHIIGGWYGAGWQRA